MTEEQDQLTGLLSIKSINNCLSKYPKCGLILLDIKKFSIFNACYGHTEGDQVLNTIAQIIRQSLPGEYKIFRSDGDEFTILLERLPAEETKRIALQVKKT